MFTGVFLSTSKDACRAILACKHSCGKYLVTVEKQTFKNVVKADWFGMLQGEFGKIPLVLQRL